MRESNLTLPDGQLSLTEQVVWKVGKALDQAAKTAHKLNDSRAIVYDIWDDIVLVFQGSTGDMRDSGLELVGHLDKYIEKSWELHYEYEIAERLIHLWVYSWWGNHPPRSVHLPGHPDFDGGTGRQRGFHYPIPIIIPLVSAPLLERRTHHWANRVRKQLSEWMKEAKTEGYIYDEQGTCWKLFSGYDARRELTSAAKMIINKAIANGYLGLAGNKTYDFHKKKFEHAITHVETKVAMWARDKEDLHIIDVVINRNYVCGEDFVFGVKELPPGCLQAIELILRRDQQMRVWRVGYRAPIIIQGQKR